MASNDLSTSFSQYAQTWNKSDELRERLEHFTAGKFRLLTEERLVVLEIEDMPVACCTAGKDAAKDIVVCFGRWATKDVDC
jgi:hypothetical protein